MKSPAKPKPPTPPVRLLVAIDVSAAELVVALQPEDATTPAAKTTKYANTPAGHRALIKTLTAKGACARVILETTGVYSLGLALALDRAADVEVMVINPRASHDYQRARLTRAKTDRVDALGLLDFLIRIPFVAWTPPAPRCSPSSNSPGAPISSNASSAARSPGSMRLASPRTRARSLPTTWS